MIHQQQQVVARLLSRRLPKLSSISIRHHNIDGETSSKTHMSMITKEDKSQNYITSYSNHGVRLSSGIGVLGPCVIFPRAVLHWNVPSADKITPESLSLFCMLEPKLDILIIGKGDWNAKVDISILQYLQRNKISVEILPTEQACSTFNFLNSEHRAVAAAIIPPTNVPDEFDDNTLSSLKLDDIDELEQSNVDKTFGNINKEGLSSLVDKHDERARHGFIRSDQDRAKSEDKEGPKKQ